ncbi:Protein of unknown function [Cotesia congregata]|uniref:Uncharacterized protein n=1 Tax=Cotesia congregata TaxID=51543 RepID=A0A8J2H863_COTCN|nr:Protein of unknown function [Cotesia congregata]
MKNCRGLRQKTIICSKCQIFLPSFMSIRFWCQLFVCGRNYQQELQIHRHFKFSKNKAYEFFINKEANS